MHMVHTGYPLIQEYENVSVTVCYEKCCVVVVKRAEWIGYKEPRWFTITLTSKYSNLKPKPIGVYGVEIAVPMYKNELKTNLVAKVQKFINRAHSLRKENLKYFNFIVVNC